MIQNHVDMLSGKVHAVPTRSRQLQRTQRRSFATCACSLASAFPTSGVVDHNATVTSEVYPLRQKHGLVPHRRLGPPQGHQRQGRERSRRQCRVISDALRAYTNGRKDDWDSQLTLAEFAIINAASTLGDNLTPFFIDCGAHPRPRSLRHTTTAPTASCRRTMRSGCRS